MADETPRSRAARAAAEPDSPPGSLQLRRPESVLLGPRVPDSARAVSITNACRRRALC
jgi:hypothetical protein